MMFAACKESKDDHQNKTKTQKRRRRRSPEHVIIHSQKQGNKSARVKMTKKKPVYYTHMLFAVCKKRE